MYLAQSPSTKGKNRDNFVMRAWLVIALLLGLAVSAFAAPQYNADLVAAADAAAADDAEGESAAVDESDEAAEEEAAAEEAPAPASPPPPPPPLPRRPSPPPAVKSSPLKAFRGAALAPAKAVGVPDNLAGPLTLALAGVGAAVALGLGPFAGAAVSTAVADALAAEPEEEEVPATPSRDNSDDLWLDRQIDKAIDFLKGLLGR